jgi:perosamine synthetase
MSTNDFIPVSAPDLSGNETAYVTQAMESTWISSKGEFLTRFEADMAESVGVAHAIATSNGTTALHLALASLNISPGDEVIVPSLTFVATANAVQYCGGTPVFVDVSPDSWCMDREGVERALSPQTKAVIPVDLFGNVADIKAIRSAVNGRNIAIVEDAAEAQGASLNGQIAGSLSDLACYSFYGNKIITTGEGGMVVTDSAELAHRARKLRDHGMDSSRPYWHDELGYNYRLTNVQAAIGVAQMERFDEISAMRNSVFGWYRERLGFDERISMQPVPAETIQAPWFFTIMLAGADKETVRKRLLEAGIDSRPLFTPMHKLPMYESGQHLPISEEIAANAMCLPTFAGMTEQQVDRVCEELLKWV